MKTIYICCPAYSYTGGPTLAHQLCYILRNSGFDAKMFYYGRITRKQGAALVHPNYIPYENAYVTVVPDEEAAIIVATETRIGVLKDYQRAIRMIWWMSVDNFYMSMGSVYLMILRRLHLYEPDVDFCRKYAHKKKYQLFKEENIIHLTQSEYAKEFLISQGISKANLYRLSDYLEAAIMNASANTDGKQRQDKVLFNPKKGFEFTQKIIALTPEVVWVPLINMTKEQMLQEFLTAKLYIDFGNHPGKDRIPREAAILNCCILTGRRGAANNKVDINIPEEYKIEDLDSNLPMIKEKIKYILAHYEQCSLDFEYYRAIIRTEEVEFKKDAVNIFSKFDQ